MHDVPFDLFLGIGSLVYVLMNFVANLTGKQWSSVEKQLGAWGVSVLAVVAAAHTNFAPGYTVAGVALSKLNGWTLVFLGLQPGSLFGVVYHVAQRFDNTGSGDVPDLPAPGPAPFVANTAAQKSPAQPEPSTGVVKRPRTVKRT